MSRLAPVTTLPFTYAAEIAFQYEELRELTRDQTAKHWRKRYWDRMHLDDLPPAVALVVFDTALVLGVHRATVLLQEALHLRPDGLVGPQTIVAARNAEPQVLDEVLASRAHVCGTLSTFDLFGLTWMRRVMRVHRAALELLG